MEETKGTSNHIHQADRVSFTAGLKINMGDYESASIQFSYSSDVGYTEGREEATKRVVGYVEKVLEAKKNEIEKERDKENERY